MDRYLKRLYELWPRLGRLQRKIVLVLVLLSACQARHWQVAENWYWLGGPLRILGGES
jgi:hypothetical protein